jgi:3,4-dihydroxy 2-butanone 4-phosphate synthase/GTP cyclohydrolase II
MSDEIRFEVETNIPTEHGLFGVRAYTDTVTGDEHLALIGHPTVAAADGVPLVRLHSECLTGEAFGSLKCECGPQLHAAMDVVAERGGVVLYLRGQEGRGIGLVNKLRAYRLQEEGRDTVDANLELGLPADARDYSAAAAILRDLGITQVRLLTNNPLKQEALLAHGIEVVERVPLEVGRNEINEGYLRTKAERMGHLLHLGATEDEQDA